MDWREIAATFRQYFIRPGFSLSQHGLSASKRQTNYDDDDPVRAHLDHGDSVGVFEVASPSFFVGTRGEVDVDKARLRLHLGIIFPCQS